MLVIEIYDMNISESYLTCLVLAVSISESAFVILITYWLQSEMLKVEIKKYLDAK